MSVVIIENNQEQIVLNQHTLDRAKNALGVETEHAAVELALEKVIEEFELKKADEEAEEEIDIDVHQLNRIPTKKSFRVKANFKFVGRRKPMKYDFSDFNEENSDE